MTKLFTLIDLLAERHALAQEKYRALVEGQTKELADYAAKKADALRRKRIARETIERALAALDGDTAHRRLVELLRRKMKNTRAATPYELKNKLIRYGLAQGYDYEAVRDAVDELIATPDDSCDVFF